MLLENPFSPSIFSPKDQNRAATVRERMAFGNVPSFWVTIARRTHPFPSRTRQLSSSAPMVLHAQVCGRVGRRPVKLRKPHSKDWGFFHLILPFWQLG